jgi:hypothetical protein
MQELFDRHIYLEMGDIYGKGDRQINQKIMDGDRQMILSQKQIR